MRRKKVRNYLLEYAKNTRTHKYTQVRRETLDTLEVIMARACRHWVNELPSKGKSI